MERDRQAREKEEKEKAEKVKKIKEQFSDTNSQWEKDKTEMQNIALGEKKSGSDETKKTQKEAGAGSEKKEAS
jgi:mannan polymerase II complex ANP1 subunit